jgi:hypothetical protein
VHANTDHGPALDIASASRNCSYSPDLPLCHACLILCSGPPSSLLQTFARHALPPVDDPDRLHRNPCSCCPGPWACVQPTVLAPDAWLRRLRIQFRRRACNGLCRTMHGFVPTPNRASCAHPTSLGLCHLFRKPRFTANALPPRPRRRLGTRSVTAAVSHRQVAPSASYYMHAVPQAWRPVFDCSL